MKIKDIVAKKDQELLKELEDLRVTLTKARFEVATRETNKHTQILNLKKDIARIKMILREREIQREEQSNEKKV